jgi:hypothetical protein
MTDNAPIIVFFGPPNGNVIAPVGAVCLDTRPDGTYWIKAEGSDAYGWEKAPRGFDPTDPNWRDYERPIGS